MVADNDFMLLYVFASVWKRLGWRLLFEQKTHNALLCFYYFILQPRTQNIFSWSVLNLLTLNTPTVFNYICPLPTPPMEYKCRSLNKLYLKSLCQVGRLFFVCCSLKVTLVGCYAVVRQLREAVTKLWKPPGDLVSLNLDPPASITPISYGSPAIFFKPSLHIIELVQQ